MDSSYAMMMNFGATVYDCSIWLVLLVWVFSWWGSFVDRAALGEFEVQHYPVAGVDEVGRGCLFGVVVAAAVILPVDAFNLLRKAGVKDSKSLTAVRRTELDRLIRSMAVDCQIGVSTVAEIETLNILGASLLAMERSIDRLLPQPNHCLIDGNQKLRFCLIPPLPQTPVVKGDTMSLSIAAASIIAKVWRDRMIVELDRQYPGYDLASNKGYPTPKHIAGIHSLGLTDQHRRTFRLKSIN